MPRPRSPMAASGSFQTGRAVALELDLEAIISVSRFYWCSSLLSSASSHVAASSDQHTQKLDSARCRFDPWVKEDKLTHMNFPHQSLVYQYARDPLHCVWKTIQKMSHLKLKRCKMRLLMLLIVIFKLVYFRSRDSTVKIPEGNKRLLKRRHPV